MAREIIQHIGLVAYLCRSDFSFGLPGPSFFHLLEDVFAQKRWFDFGNSTEQQGRYLNDGLIEQKEGFGGRAIVHDYFRLTL